MEIHAYDMLNGVTYIGHKEVDNSSPRQEQKKEAKSTLLDVVVIPTIMLIDGEDQSYSTAVRKAYEEREKTIDKTIRHSVTLSLEDVVAHHKVTIGVAGEDSDANQLE